MTPLFIDTETRSAEPVPSHGPWRSGAAGTVILIAWALGEDEVKVEQGWPGIRLADCSKAFRDACEAVLNGEAVFVAWNAGFDRVVLDLGVPGWRENGLSDPDLWQDAMYRATRFHLPGALDGASQRIGVALKAPGRRLINLFCDSRVPGGAPDRNASDWAEFIAYAARDVEAMRSVWNATPPLTAAEAADWSVNERINDRGIPIDTELAAAAARMADFARERDDETVRELTGGAASGVNAAKAILSWVGSVAADDTELRNVFRRRIVESEDENGDLIVERKMTLARDAVEDAMLLLEARGDAGGRTYRVLSARLYGASTAPAKFGKMLRMVSPDGRLRGQFVCGGAPATGRYSSRGVQVHNFVRKGLGTADDEIEAVETLTGLPVEAAWERLTGRFGPVGRTLGRLLRPCVMAPDGRALVWADWSAIEARILPWLAKGFDGSEHVLGLFSGGGDVYRVQAGEILGKRAADVTDEERQAYGKVPVLSLGFGGGRGALLAMARNYGVWMPEDVAARVVDRWRAANPWAVRFWNEVWDAVQWCMAKPGPARAVGRLVFSVRRDLCTKGDTLVMILPDGRRLFYPGLRWQRRARGQDAVEELTYRRGAGRARIWRGTLVENAVQGTAACLLRDVLRRLDREAQDVVWHTHDEVVIEVGEQDVAAGKDALRRAMMEVPDWANGLPLAVDVSAGVAYSKAKR